MSRDGGGLRLFLSRFHPELFETVLRFDPEVNVIERCKGRSASFWLLFLTDELYSEQSVTGGNDNGSRTILSVYQSRRGHCGNQEDLRFHQAVAFLLPPIRFVGQALGYSLKSSGGVKTIAALKSYGLIEGS